MSYRRFEMLPFERFLSFSGRHLVTARTGGEVSSSRSQGLPHHVSSRANAITTRTSNFTISCLRQLVIDTRNHGFTRINIAAEKSESHGGAGETGANHYIDLARYVYRRQRSVNRS